MPDPEMHVQTDRARGGTTPHITRYILLISLPLAVAALLAVLVLF